jgi:hypothetical protein
MVVNQYYITRSSVFVMVLADVCYTCTVNKPKVVINPIRLREQQISYTYYKKYLLEWNKIHYVSVSWLVLLLLYHCGGIFSIKIDCRGTETVWRCLQCKNHFGSVMVSVFVSSMVDRGFEPMSWSFDCPRCIYL